MNPSSTRRFLSRNILIRMSVILLAVLAVGYWQRELLLNIYIRNQLSAVGWIINGGIVLLFLLGLGRMIQLFARYVREESALRRFVENVQRSIEPNQGVSMDSMIAERYHTLLELHSKRTAINHNALASSLLAYEASFISLPKFINNVLILTGVFGTIVSLSIALLGASDMLSATREVEGLGTVIHGMSTALSTTMTAILAYLFFGYFYLKLNDTLSYLLSRVEHVTATLLLPKFQIQEETVMMDFSEMIRASTAVIKQANDSQERLTLATAKLEQVLEKIDADLSDSGQSLDNIQKILKNGFRLPE